MKHFYEIYGMQVKEIKAGSNDSIKPVTGQISKRYNIYSWMQTMFGGEYNPDSLSHQDYMEMLRDPQVDTAYALITDMLLSKKVMITAASDSDEDQQVKEFVEDMIENLSISFRQTRSDLYTGILFGFAVAECVYKIDEHGRYVWDRVKGIDIRTIWNGLKYDDFGNVIEVIQMVHGIGSLDPIIIPADKCIIYSRNPMHGNMYGRSDFNSLYDVSFMKSQIIRILMIYIQKHGAPTIAGFAGEGGDPDQMQENLDEIMEGRANLVFKNGDSIEVIESSKDGSTFFNAINYLDNMIFRRLRIGSLLLGQAGDNSGSLAQSQTHDSILSIVLDGVHEELAGIIQSKIRDIVNYNFNVIDYPKVQFEQFKEQDLLKLLAELQPYGKDALVNMDENWFKQLLSMIIERMTGIKMDITEDPALVSPPTTAEAKEGMNIDTSETQPTNNTTDSTSSTTTPTTTPQISNLNSDLKVLMPNGGK